MPPEHNLQRLPRDLGGCVDTGIFLTWFNQMGLGKKGRGGASWPRISFES